MVAMTMPLPADMPSWTRSFTTVVKECGPDGVAELIGVLAGLPGVPGSAGQLLPPERLPSRHPRVFRLRFSSDGWTRSLIVKRLEPGTARRDALVVSRWLPAIGLGENGSPLVGTAAARNGDCVWHVYEDLGDRSLGADNPDPVKIECAVQCIATLHTGFAEHPLLAECRLHGSDFGIHDFCSNVRHAILGLRALEPPRVTLSAEERVLRDRLLARLERLLDDAPRRAQAFADLGGPETLLHGDLWPSNIFVVPAQDGWRVRLIDWDHVGVGPFAYDLSTFLSRLAPRHRPWALQRYREAVGAHGWRLPPLEELEPLFETAEYARLANRLIWPAIALFRDQASWGFEELAEIERWFEGPWPPWRGPRHGGAAA